MNSNSVDVPMHNPYAPPQSGVLCVPIRSYASISARSGALILDLLLFGLVLSPLYIVHGTTYFVDHQPHLGALDVFFGWVVSSLWVLLFWRHKSATPGKIVAHLRIVDAETGDTPSSAQWLVRYLAYVLSLLSLGLGFIWIIWDAKKQSWHDKLANTVVVQH